RPVRRGGEGPPEPRQGQDGDRREAQGGREGQVAGESEGGLPTQLNETARPCRSGSTTGPGGSSALTSFSSSSPSSSPTPLLRLTCSLGTSARHASESPESCQGENPRDGGREDRASLIYVGTPHSC